MSADSASQFRLALGHLFRIFHNTAVSTSRYEIAMKLADFPGWVWCPEAVEHVLPIEAVSTERVFLRTPDNNEEAIAMSISQARQPWNPPRGKL